MVEAVQTDKHSVILFFTSLSITFQKSSVFLGTVTIVFTPFAKWCECMCSHVFVGVCVCVSAQMCFGMYLCACV